MATITIPKLNANFETSLAASMSATATTLTLGVSVDKDSVTLSGLYSLTLDEGTTSEEHMLVTLTGSAGTVSKRGLSKVNLNTEVTANKFVHNRGASVKFTNVSLLLLNRLLNGDDTFNGVSWAGVTAISGLATPTSGETTKAANVGYVNDVVIAGDVDSTTAIRGIGKSTYDQAKSLGTVTVTIASPGVATLTAHGLILGDTIKFTTTGALPTGIVSGTAYFVITAGLTANDFQFAETSGGAAINTSGSQSGTHTLHRLTPFFVSDTDLRVPTQGENDALVGTSGTPSSSNKYTTNDTNLLNEVLTNKSTDVTFGGVAPSATLYPTQKAVKHGIGITNIISTSFETVGRFTSTVVGSGANGFGGFGVSISSGTTNPSSTNLTFALVINGNIVAGNPSFSTVLAFDTGGVVPNAGSFYVGIGSPTVAGAGITYTPSHAGFKILYTAGPVATLYATQADGTTENVSADLTTISLGTNIEVALNINSTTSIDYYWRLGGGTWSAATNLTANMPSSTTARVLQFSTSNNASVQTVYGVICSACYKR